MNHGKKTHSQIDGYAGNHEDCNGEIGEISA
jgi:hypothetical protein